MYKYNISDYLDSVTREIQKRATTYPKIIKKKEKKGIPKDEIFEEIMKQQNQITLLIQIETLLKYQDEIGTISAPLANSMMKELKREMKMRKRYYPRLIYFKRIEPLTAEHEKYVWEELIQYFDEKYLSVYKQMPA